MVFTGVTDARADKPQTVSPEVPQTTVQTGDTISTRMTEIRSVLDQERHDVSELVILLRQTTDHAERVDLQRRITDVKKNAEVEMLRVQLRYARTANQVDAVAKLEASIKQILDPVVPTVSTSATDQNESGSRR
jgi:hypothetical protein